MREVSERVRSSALDHGERRGARRPWLSACLLAAALAVASFAPPPIVLPLVSVILVLSGFMVGAYAWFKSERRAAGIFTCWDQAGLFVFAGFVAALAGDSAETMNFIETFVQRLSANE